MEYLNLKDLIPSVNFFVEYIIGLVILFLIYLALLILQLEVVVEWGFLHHYGLGLMIL